MQYRFLLAGGGTGGHVFPALAVARLLRDRGHELLFVGTREGMESKLVPDAGHDIEFIRIGGLNRVGLKTQFKSAWQLPTSVVAALNLIRRWNPHALFSMGGYVAGPVMLAATLRRLPLIIMEPDAVPGFANRQLAGRVYKALVGFDSTARYFPCGRTEVTGLPIRDVFFDLQPKNNGPFTLLVTGGSRGARTLNRASRESWPLFRAADAPIRIVHQSGAAEHEALMKEFAAVGVQGEVVPFIRDMPAAFAGADIVLARSGAGSVGELAAARKPSILVPLPFAADDHQRKNAEALVGAGGARMILDQELTGERLFREVEELRKQPVQLLQMRDSLRSLARRGAAQRAVEVLEEAAYQKNANVR